MKGCLSDPPATPSGSTSDWDNTSKGVGTLITYTCDDVGPVTRVVCDAETLTCYLETLYFTSMLGEKKFIVKHCNHKNSIQYKKIG